MELRNAPALPASLAPVSGPSIALLQALTNVKSESNAKDKARELADAKSQPIEVKTKTDPTTGRSVSEIKGIVHGDEDAEMEAAYTIPQVELATALAPYAKQFGHREPGGADIREKLGSFWGRYHLARETGAGPLRSLIRSALIEARPEKREQAAAAKLGEQVDRQRLYQATQDFRVASPVIAEADRQRRMNVAESKEDRLRRKEQRSAIGRTIAATDFTLLDEEEWVPSVAAQNGVKPEEIGDEFRAQIERTARQQTRKKHEVMFNAFRQDNALGQYPTWDAAKEAFGGELTPEEDRRGLADWKEKRALVIKAEESAARESARFDAFLQRLATASKEKPQKFSIGDAQVFTADDLTTHIGAENVDQTSLQWTMKRRLEHVSPNSKQYRDLALQNRQAEVTVQQILSKAKLSTADLKNPAALTEKLTKAQRTGLLEPGDAEQLQIALERAKHFLQQAREMDAEAEKLRQGLAQFKPAKRK